MATYILGAPGSGKSAIRSELAALLADRVVLDWDDFMDAACDLAATDVRREPALWPAYRRLVRDAVEAAGAARVVLLGVCTPDELPGWPIDAWVLLDCSDEERRRRLAAREQDEDDVASAMQDAAAYRALGMRALDTTDLSTTECAAAVAALVRRDRSSARSDC